MHDELQFQIIIHKKLLKLRTSNLKGQRKSTNLNVYKVFCLFNQRKVGIVDASFDLSGPS